MTLRLKLALLVTLMIGAIAGFINFYLPARMQARMLAHLETEARNTARMVSFSVAPALVFADRASGADALRGVEVLTDLSYLVVEDASGARFAAVHPERMAASSSGGAGTGAVDLGNSVYRVSQPVMHERVAVGTIHVGISLDSMRNEVDRMRRTIGWISLFVFLAGLAVTIGISTYVTRPLVKMVGTAKDIAAGDWKRRAPIVSHDEAGKLALSFNAMLDRLDEARREREELNHALERRVAERTAEREQEVQERRRGEAALQKSNERFTLASAAVDGALYDWDIREDRVFWTDGLTRVFGYTLDDGPNAPQWWSSRIHPDDADRVLRQRQGDVAAARDFMAEYRFRSSDQKYLSVLDRGRVLRDESGQAARMVGFLENVTPLKILEEQVRQGQKMEAVGRLAGGIAHDFNNLLTTILGYSHLLLGTFKEEQPQRADLEEIRKAGERAASLTQQLLAFSRRQVIESKVLNLNGVIADLENMLRRLIGEDIELETRLDPLIAPVKADRGQIEQVIVNVVVNARDAMDRGGRLLIRTENAVLDESYCRDHPEVRPGPYSMIAIRDTGCGMDEETRRRIFEPFFTTKAVDKGTGLGMATVYGVVKQSGGDVRVESEIGRGTTITIYLPRATECEVGVPVSVPPPQAGNEAVLLVEDEAGVRKLVKGVLRSKGYRVIEADGLHQALAKLADPSCAIDLLLTDVVMPGMSGRELADRVLRDRPEMALLYMSGYTEDRMVLNGVETSEIGFLQKPFTPEQLLRRVHDTLDGARANTPPTHVRSAHT